MSERVSPRRPDTSAESLQDVPASHAAGAPPPVEPGQQPVTDPARPDEALAADLREAFGSGVYALDPEAAPWPAKPSGGSAAFAAGLGAPPTVGSRLGDFEILGELGRGGMGVVYRTRQISLDRQVALKVLPACARGGRMAVARFKIEAQAAAKLHHTNIVPVYGQGECDGHFFYAMELVEGQSLDAVIQRCPDLLSSSPDVRSQAAGRQSMTDRDTDELEGCARADAGAAPASDSHPLRRAAQDYRHLAKLVAEVADGLEHAHSQGVIHRDIKPHNLMLGLDNRLHITDFGLARMTDHPHLTVSGELMGTPAYLSPEQVRAGVGEVDHRTDIYSLGVTLYELLTRRRPFEGRTREQIISGICTTEPMAPRRVDAGIPRDLETVCLRALEKDPRRRYARAEAMATDLLRFCAGRPILSRRVSYFERAVKWAKRHRAASTAIVSAVVVLILGTGLTLSVRARRLDQARGLIESAHDRLVYLDFHRPGLVADAIDEAEALGADSFQVALVRAMAAMSNPGPTGLVEQAEQLLQEDPANMEAWYLLAFAQSETRRREDARETIARADRLGGPATAAEWFLRGLAVHFLDAEDAVRCYRKANDLRAAEHEFYPQAILHLARAHNQRMYSQRTAEAFAEAERRLLQLTEHGHYDAFPYYLLSISHRLAAEITTGAKGTRDDSGVDRHYAAGLKWARDGQKEYPTSDRPVTAEAECLESMGDFEGAIEARTRAIALADRQFRRCEGHHYRWRLNYWAGRLDAALQDLEFHAGCDPQSRFYAHVYPALVYAEAGDMETALRHARALAEEAPADAQAVLWSATCLRLLGREQEAVELLDARAEEVEFDLSLAAAQSAEWVELLYGFCAGNVSLDDLLALTDQVDAPWTLRGEAHFHAAAAALAAGDRAAALDGLAKAYRSFDGEERYTYHAKVLGEKLRADPRWPPWIPLAAGTDTELLDGHENEPYSHSETAGKER